MANECDNILTIAPLEGKALPVGLVDAITDENGYLSLTKAVPVPAGLSDDDAFKWMIENWGTDGMHVESSQVKQVDDGLYVYCETAGTPPIDWLLTISEHFPSARFSLMYLEPNDEFGGELRAVAGMVEHEAQEDEVTLQRWTLMGGDKDDWPGLASDDDDD